MKKTIPLPSLALAGLAALAALPLAADEGRIPVHQPMSLTQPGRYVLTRNITATTGPAIEIATGGVDLDLNGHSVTGKTGQDALVLIGGGTPDPGGDVRIHGGRIVGGLNGIHALVGTDYALKLCDLDIAGQEQDGLLLEDGQELELIDAQLRDAARYAVNIKGSAVDAKIRAVASKISIHGLIKAAMASGHIHDALVVHVPGGLCPTCPLIELSGSPGFTIAESTLVGTGSSGGAIDGIAADAASGDLVIRDNTITGFGRYGINLASQGNVVRDNTINRNLSHGISVAGSTNLVEHNRIGHNSGLGINFVNAVGPHIYRDNVLRGNGTGGVGGVSGNTDAGGNVP